MARLYYEDEVFVMPDETARGLQEVIINAISQGASIWFPMPLSRSEGQHRVTELLIGPGIPFRFEYDFSSEAEVHEHVAAGVQRTREMFQGSAE